MDRHDNPLPAGAPGGVALELRQVILPVADLEQGLDFYERVLGLAVAVRDAGYVALDAGHVKVALATPEERPLEAGPALAFKCSAIDLAAARLRAAGVAMGPLRVGSHERSIEICDPSGHAIVLYSPL